MDNRFEPTPGSPKEPLKKPQLNLMYVFVAIMLAVFVNDYYQMQKNVMNISYDQFIQELQKKNVKEVELSLEQIIGEYKAPPQNHPHNFITMTVNDPNLMDRLLTSGAQFRAVKESALWKIIGSWILPVLIIYGLWSMLFSRMGKTQGSFMSFGKSKAKIYAEKDLKIRFLDVAGVDEAKAELQEVVEFLKNPKKFSQLGGRMPKGILLVGPPGTGKTMLAKAVAGEASVPFFSINGSEFVEMFVGLGAARVRDLFEQARTHAPCIIFIDELDALGKARGINAITGSNDEKEQTLNQLLAELDGFDSTSGIILLAATNRPEILDPALLRAGRFDRQILVDRPDKQGRMAILNIYAKKVSITKDVDLEIIASMTAGFSGADLANLVNEATLMATRRGADGVEMKDFNEAIERIVAGLERKNRLLSPDEKRRVAYHEMGHATVALAQGKGLGEAVQKVSIIPRGIGALGFTIQRPLEERFLMDSHELEGKLQMLLGGRAAEKLFFPFISTGAANDLDKATDIARNMVTRYGMSEKLGNMIYETETTPFLGGDKVWKHAGHSEKTSQLIDEETKEILDHALAEALAVLEAHRNFIEAAVQLLIKEETLDEKRLQGLWIQFSPIAPQGS